jgi:lysophospholipase L1-like esterase
MKTLDRPETPETGGMEATRPRRRRRRPPGRRAAPAGRALVVILVGLLLWLLLAAPSLKRAAEASPDGARRTVSLALLTPIAATSDMLGLKEASDSLQRALGRDPDAPPGGELFGEEAEAVPEDFGVDPSVLASPDPLPSIDPERVDQADDDLDYDPAYALREPRTNNKLRVVVVGDSLAMGLSTALGRVFDPALVQFVDQARLSTGLARSDYFNWIKGMQQITDRFRADVVVVLIGVNDDQSIILPDDGIVPEGSEEWREVYENRVDSFLAAATDKGGRIVWVGLPPLADERHNSLAQGFNESFDAGVDDYPSAYFFDTYERFSRNGEYAPFGRDANSNVAQLRGGDGVHFTTTGYDTLAREVASVMVKKWGLTQKAIED